MSERPKSTTPQTTETGKPPEPGFGWTTYAEYLNGRFAMIGIVALIVIELTTGQGLIAWLGF